MVSFKWDAHVFETISSFHSIEHYYKTVEQQMEKSKKEDQDRIDSLPIPVDEEEYQTEYQPELQYHEYEYEELLPSITNYSFVIMLFSNFEFQIKKFCEEVKRRYSMLYNLGDFRGSFVDRFEKFLRNTSGNGFLQEDKDRISVFIKVRNCIAHNNGFLTANDKDIKKVLKENRELSLEATFTGERLKVDTIFCYSFIEYSIGLFRRLFNEHGFGPEHPIIDKK